MTLNHVQITMFMHPIKKTSGHAKKQENVIHNQDKNESVETLK